jgi:5-formyltetrahydrofolate cyclo-ligase
VADDIDIEDLRRAKAELRERMRALRDTIPPDERASLGAVIEERVLRLPAVRDARAITAFHSFGSEVSTASLIELLTTGERRVLLPYLDAGEMHMAHYRPGDHLAPAGYGAMEPAVRVPVPPEEIDVCLVPGLAFDPRGYRVGYGGGYFDRFLPRLDPRAVRIGLAFHLQVVPDVPHGTDDQPVDLVVTDAETLACGRGGRPD